MKMLISQFLRRPLGLASLFVILLFCVVAVYAPFLASGKPIAVYYDGSLYFPLFRYLLYPGYYTKPIDLFFNALIFTLPILLFWRRRWAFPLFCTLQLALFLWALLGTHKDPALDLELLAKRRTLLQEDAKNRSHSFEIAMMSPYQKLNKVMQYRRDLQSHENVVQYLKKKTAASTRLETLKSSEEDKRWLDRENAKVAWVLWPLIRTYHWEEYAGGSQAMNQDVPWWELTRLNRKDFTAALIFGVRVSLVVGIIAVAIALLIGVPVGCIAGFYGGKIDILLCRLIEVWESMPTFFMLLFVVAILQSKSIFLVISVIGIFGWMGFTRFVRGEFFKQRNLSYVEACRSLGFSDRRIMFKHILPNALPPLLTLLPFAIMGAISAEAGLSFLGLGEEGSSSWGVLMDEGRNAFPGESYLLWPPAILLTILLIAIALVGDALRDALDPKLQISE